MSIARRRVDSDEGRERFAAASFRGGLCAVCGVTLGADEPVYIVRVEVRRKSLSATGTEWSRRPANRDAPLGRECVAPTLLARLEERGPEPCVRCGRPVYYEVDRAGRRLAACSRRCHQRGKG